MNATSIILAIAVIVAIFILLFGRRIRAHYGSLKPSSAVGTSFEQYRENSELTYYSSGPDLYPNAVMGLKKTITLDSKLWKKRTFEEGEFRTVIKGMQQKASPLCLFLKGFAIYDKDGKEVGEWYSLPGIHVVIKTTAPGHLSITTPPNDMYDKREGEQ